MKGVGVWREVLKEGKERLKRCNNFIMSKVNTF